MFRQYRTPTTVPLCGCVVCFLIVVPILRLLAVPDRLRFISTRLRSMDRPSVFRAAHVDRLAMHDANRARANLFRYSASASRVSTKSNRFAARSTKIVRRAPYAHLPTTKKRRGIAAAAVTNESARCGQRR
jgi:hypothetical protein